MITINIAYRRHYRRVREGVCLLGGECFLIGSL